jgi:hypothetical protein
MSLESKLNDASNLSRLNAVDAAYAGSPGSRSNFKARWQGYNEDGQAVVKVGDQTYAGKNLANTYTKKDSTVILRVGKGIRTVNY